MRIIISFFISEYNFKFSYSIQLILYLFDFLINHLGLTVIDLKIINLN